MCLSASTARRPLFSTAYKIITKFRSGKYSPPFFLFNDFNPFDGKWIEDDSKELIYYDYGFYNKNAVSSYNSGFHSYINLTHAIKMYEDLSHFSTEQFEVWEIDTDDIVEYGVENQKDVVVSRKIKFVQRII